MFVSLMDTPSSILATLCNDEPAVRTGIMLDERVSAAWRKAGEVWEAVISEVQDC